MKVLLQISGSALRGIGHTFPGFVCSSVPHARETLALASLYLFLQALGLLWVFLVSLLAVVCTRIVTEAVESGRAGAGGAAPLLERPMHAVAVCYVYYCVVRVLALFGQSMWTVTWELYHDFPTMKHMLERGSRKKVAATATAALDLAVDVPVTLSAGRKGCGGLPTPTSAAVTLPPTSTIRHRRSASDSTSDAPHGAGGADGGAPPDASPRGAGGGGAPPDASPRSKAASLAALSRRKHQDTRRGIVLVCPLVVLIVLHMTLLVGQVACEGVDTELCLHSGLFNPVGRMNRNARFVLFLSMMQWLQAWTGFFPKWYVALPKAHKDFPLLKVLRSSVVFVLVPISCVRLILWFLKPAGSGQVHLLMGIRHFFIDSLLVIGWSLWMLSASTAMLRPEILKLSGFSARNIRDPERWRHMATLFKFTLFFWQAAHFVRGVASFGFGHAQNDAIATSILYPVLMCIVWTATFITVAVSRLGRTFLFTASAFAGSLAGLLSLAWLICTFVGRGQMPLLVIFVWLHLCRQAFRIVRRWVLWVHLLGANSPSPRSPALGVAASSPTNSGGGGEAAAASLLTAAPGDTGTGARDQQNGKSGTVSFALNPQAHKDLKTTYTFERRVGRVAVRALMAICISFCATLAACVFMGAVQQRHGLILSDLVWWRSLPGGVELTNTHASRLKLTFENATSTGLRQSDEELMNIAGPEDTPHYAVCGHKWHGLQLVDYALMSLMAYMEAESTSSSLLGLLKVLYPHKQVSIEKAHIHTGRRWLDLNIRDCSGTEPRGKACREVTVVAVSGTDPTQIMDYAENLRMWTEPVCLQILSFVFPTVRVWPRDTTAMVIAGIHSILKHMAVQDDQWHYRAILEHIRQMPSEREVVITGHSLGGGIALIIGALTGHLAVAIQPPGVYHSLAKHQVQQSQRHHGQAVHKRSVSLIVEGDWIQNFDGHGGLVQTMGCDQTQKSIAVGCHLIEGAICHLLRHCGDEARRFATCKHEYTPVSGGMILAQEVLAFVKVSGQGSYIYSRLRSVAMVGSTISVIMFARYGAPSLPRFG